MRYLLIPDNDSGDTYKIPIEVPDDIIPDPIDNTSSTTTYTDKNKSKLGTSTDKLPREAKLKHKKKIQTSLICPLFHSEKKTQCFFLFAYNELSN